MNTPITANADVNPTYGQYGVRPVDTLTGSAPIGRIAAYLDSFDPNNLWRPTGIPAIVTPGGIIAYPGLERHAVAAGLPKRIYRVRLIPEFYVPRYCLDAEGIKFTVFPYDADRPPATISRIAEDALMLPAPNYPFQTHIPVLWGVVTDPSGAPVPNVSVAHRNNPPARDEQAITDARGTFAIALRWVSPNTVISIAAVDGRTRRSGAIQIKFPVDLGTSQTIPIS
ncbi:carboxypeptidase-like regulatory domain-containing protein [Paraburkholderia sp. BR14374]|uniref:carboxypeptidase-like regulatory domain-containing protein n=1 Tax=Paraburkholderia sp. BR14374 TaxID=3237007 RepID=UPI0034CE50DA